jgi:type IX secretion system substrate protein
MKKFYFLLLSATLLSVGAFAQSCPEDVNVDNITRPTCGTGNGQFTIEMKGYGTSTTITSGTLDITVTGISTAYSNSQLNTTIDNLPLSGLFPDTYIIKIAQHGASVVCDSFTFILRADYVPGFTHVQSPATGCLNADGSILLGGGLAGTDSVSWVSSSTPQFTRISTLSGGNTITGLTPGLYYVTVKGPGTINCYTTDTVSVFNSGTACPAATFCATATDSTNLFPDGTFGTSTPSAGIPPSSSLPVGTTGYQFQPIGPYSPEDGFYAIVNNTYIGSYNPYDGSGGPWFTPFDGQWLPGWDHDHFTTAGNPANGNMLVVNADYDPNIVIEDTINNLCVGKTYQFSAYIRSLNPNCCGNEPANETFLIDGVGLYNTGNIWGTTGIVASDWKQVGFTFVPTTTTAVFSLRNNAPGGQGNDFAIDDIYVGSCAPTVTIDTIPSNMCNYPLANDTAIVTDQSDLFVDYQWQVDKQDGNGYVNVGGSQVGTFGTAGANAYYATTPFPSPLLPAAGWTYRLIVATAPANLAFPTCRFTSLDSSVIPLCPNPPLPVTFISVKAQLNNTVGNISWKVGDQTNVNHYILQKSTDQANYIDVTSVPAIKGSSVLNYQGNDYNLTEGTTYYRIESVDIDGYTEYSPTVALSYGGGGTITVVNPVLDVLKISTPPATTVRQVIILDAIGRMILEQDDINATSPSIDVSSLTQGFYNLKVVSTDGTVTNLSFIKR